MAVILFLIICKLRGQFVELAILLVTQLVLSADYISGTEPYVGNWETEVPTLKEPHIWWEKIKGVTFGKKH